MPLLPTRISGAPLRALASLGDHRAFALALRQAFAAQLGIDALARLTEADRGQLPWDSCPLPGRPPRAGEDQRLPAPAPSAAWPRTSGSYAARYADGRATPRAVAERALAEARALARRAAPAGGPILACDDAAALRDADAATRRFAEQRPLGPLDGVPIVIKEETDVAGLPTRVGTAWLPATPAARDATVVARLRAAGAIILGSSPMTELGLSPLGVNPHRAMPRNPHHPGHLAGGSSTGSAVAVASGLCPVALAADGGGSIRIPASLCGVFGLKPTYGRLSRGGDFYRGTMNHLGPIGASTTDLAIFLDTCAGFDAADPATRDAPAGAPGAFSAALGRGVRGLTIGLLEAMWSEASPPVAAAGRAALAALERAGAKLVPASIPLATVSPPIGYLTIGLEELADMLEARHTRRAAIGPDLRVTLASLSTFGPADYLDAQRLRARLREQTARALGAVDLLALPSASIPAPAITDAEAASGILDAGALHGVCRTMFLGNLTGLPASTAPVGRDPAGLPLGLQLLGDAWDEPTVLAATAELERSGAAEVHPPAMRAADPW
jgi:Asp-tRNA(Asn)/Glu-tRNA(Gln) amidotransferase A subunit family amidase